MDNTVLVLKTVNANMTSAYDSSFVYPRQGMVSCPDWDPAPACGHGLHGFIRGTGNGGLASWQSDSVWLIIRVNVDDIVDLEDKVKFRCGEVIYAGDQKTATDMLKAAYPDAPVIGCTATAGYKGTATAGDKGTATAGYSGTATAGDYGTATAGDSGTATAGDSGTATAGDNGTTTAGDNGTATAGDNGTATAGDYGTATAGDNGTATAGTYGTAIAGNYGIASAREGGDIHIRWYDCRSNRYRTAVGYVGEDGILPNVLYHVVNGKLVEKR